MEPNRDPPEITPSPPAESSEATSPAGGDAFDVRNEAGGDLAALRDGEPPRIVPAAALENPDDTLSPAVRRLVRHYDLDITGIHGTGPSGRIRVGDVIGMLGSRADGTARAADAGPRAGTAPDSDDTLVEARAGTPYRGTGAVRSSERTATAAPDAPATTVYECDLSRVLSHRKAQRRNDVEVLITSYYLVACAEALQAVPEVVAGEAADTQFGVLLASTDGEVRTTLVDAVDDSPLASIDDRLRSFDQALRAIDDADLRDANLLIHHYGLSGSLLTTPTPLGTGHVASVGIGRVRRQIVVKNHDGDEAPHVAAMGHVTLTFLPQRLPLNRANRFVAQLVRVLEQWPD